MFQKKILFVGVLAVMLFSQCAKRGGVTGGAKDTLAPVLKASFPKNYGTDFKGNEIKLVFDEYVKLKNVNKQLIVSPPMKNAPLITPSTASKQIVIKINDTLQPNTTYSFNFGESIEDNNEGNKLQQFKYVFSTGKFVDSLQIGGVVRDAYMKDVESFVSVMLYEKDENYNDSIVYKKMPRYITNTLDSLKSFKIENIKAGTYVLVAMKDYNNNNIFNPKKDKIGFLKKPIKIPNDSVFSLNLFKEEMPFKVFKPVQQSGNKLYFGYEGKWGEKKNLPKISIKNQKGANVLGAVTRMAKSDSLQVWFSGVKGDSLLVEAMHGSKKENFGLKVRDMKKDTLQIKLVQNGVLHLNDVMKMEFTTPLKNFDAKKMKLINKDSIAVPFELSYDELDMQMKVLFKQEQSQKYSLKLEKGAVEDVFGNISKEDNFRLMTRALEEYGTIQVDLIGVKRYPLMVELANKKGEVYASQWIEKGTSVHFENVEPAEYLLRLVYDDNGNKVWDTGSFLEKRYAEEIIYFVKPIQIRSNWDYNQAFDLNVK